MKSRVQTPSVEKCYELSFQPNILTLKNPSKQKNDKIYIVAGFLIVVTGDVASFSDFENHLREKPQHQLLVFINSYHPSLDCKLSQNTFKFMSGLSNLYFLFVPFTHFKESIFISQLFLK